MPTDSEEAAVVLSPATTSVAAANFVPKASARIVAFATAVPMDRTVSDEAAADVPVPPVAATVSEDAAVAVPVVLAPVAVKTGVVTCEIAPEGASRTTDWTAVANVPAVFVLK